MDERKTVAGKQEKKENREIEAIKQQLVEILYKNYRNKGEDVTKKVFQENGMPNTTMLQMIEKISNILYEEMPQQLELQQQFYEKLIDYIMEVEPMALDANMRSLVCSVASDLARLYDYKVVSKSKHKK